MSMNIIDIASWQEGIVPSNTDADGVIIKATGGTGYVNDRAHGAWKDWHELADEVLASGKKLGLYHYYNERGCSGSWEEEAAFFLEVTKDYYGKFVPVLDWENDALMNHPTVAAAWMDRVHEVTGSQPFFYGYASNVNSTDYSSCTRNPLWMASYLSKYTGCGFVTDPDNIWDTGDWEDMDMYQYTSQGRIRGYDGNLDLSYFYKDTSAWDAMANPRVPEQEPGEPENDYGFIYQAHIQNIGWCDPVHDGQCAGTCGFALRMEALRINPVPGWKLRVKAHIQDIGWVAYDIEHGNDTIIGTVGEEKRIEMLSICVLERPKDDKRTLWFQIHEQDTGWKQWTSEGYASGTDGLWKRLEAVRVVLR